MGIEKFMNPPDAREKMPTDIYGCVRTMKKACGNDSSRDQLSLQLKEVNTRGYH